MKKAIQLFAVAALLIAAHGNAIAYDGTVVAPSGQTLYYDYVDSTRQAVVHPGSVETGRWYDVRLSVATDSVKAWLDEELVFSDEFKQINY